MKLAILCSGLGNVFRGHEVFVSSVFDTLRNEVDITLFKGGGESGAKEVVVPHIPRYSPDLDGMTLVGPEKWRHSEQEARRQDVEFRTFGYSALRLLISGDYDVIHCAEDVVADILYEHRLLFAKTPKIVYSNGGAMPRRKLPACDFVQEHTAYSFARSATDKAVFIPHGVDLKKFDPSKPSSFRQEHGISDDALVVLSVGNISPVHKRMDYVIREVSQLDQAHLVICGQQSPASKSILELGHELMGDRITFTAVPHEKLAEAYKAADVFVLASTFETFGIVYIEAMAMRLPVIATNHENQQQIIQVGVFIDVEQQGAMRDAIAGLDEDQRRSLGDRARKVVERDYDLEVLKGRYLEFYEMVHAAPPIIPQYGLSDKIRNNVRNALDRLRG